MVKGISKQVIVVRPPERGPFDQAIFILRDRDDDGAVTGEALLRQARQAADTYLRTQITGGRALGRRLRPLFHALLGALSASVLWAVAVFVL